MKAIIFDLDMTLVNSAALEQHRKMQLWRRVKRELDRVRPFDTKPSLAPHKLPAALKKRGVKVGIVTSSPGWYAKAIIDRFSIDCDVLVAYEDTESHKPDPEPIETALRELSVEPHEAAYVGDDAVDVEASHHAGVVSIGAAWRYTSAAALWKGFCGTSADIVLWTTAPLLNPRDLPRHRLLGERFSAGKRSTWHRGSTLMWRENGYCVQALGRYMKSEDARQATHDWSGKLLGLKSADDDAKLFGRILADYINRTVFRPMTIVPVPPKPDQRNRFSELLDHANDLLEREVRIHRNGLKCVKPIDGYKEMNADERRKAVKGAFKSKRKWQGRVLLLDDVFTTGAVSEECVRILKKNGAEQVRVLSFGITQQCVGAKSCPACGRRMRIRTNGTTREKFWGCSGYPDDCRHTVSLEADE